VRGAAHPLVEQPVRDDTSHAPPGACMLRTSSHYGGRLIGRASTKAAHLTRRRTSAPQTRWSGLSLARSSSTTTTTMAVAAANDEDDGDDDNECYRHSMTRRNHLPTSRPPAAAISSSGGASCLVRCSASGPRAPAIFVSHICSSICLSILSSQRCPTTSVIGGTI